MAATVFNSCIKFTESVGGSNRERNYFKLQPDDVLSIPSWKSGHWSCNYWCSRTATSQVAWIQKAYPDLSNLHQRLIVADGGQMAENVSWALPKTWLMMTFLVRCCLFRIRYPENLDGRGIIEISSRNFIWRSIMRVCSQSNFSWLECHKSTVMQRETEIMSRWSFRKGNEGLSVIVSMATGEPFLLNKCWETSPLHVCQRWQHGSHISIALRLICFVWLPWWQFVLGHSHQFCKKHFTCLWRRARRASGWPFLLLLFTAFWHCLAFWTVFGRLDYPCCDIWWFTLVKVSDNLLDSVWFSRNKSSRSHKFPRLGFGLTSDFHETCWNETKRDSYFKGCLVHRWNCSKRQMAYLFFFN